MHNTAYAGVNRRTGIVMQSMPLNPPDENLFAAINLTRTPPGLENTASVLTFSLSDIILYHTNVYASVIQLLFSNSKIPAD